MTANLRRVELVLDSNGNIEDTVPEVGEVRAGDVIEYNLHPDQAALWQFKGWMSNSAGGVKSVSISKDGKAMTLTVGEGAEGEEIDITLIYQRDITDLELPKGAIMADPVIGSNASVVRFR